MSVGNVGTDVRVRGGWRILGAALVLAAALAGAGCRGLQRPQRAAVAPAPAWPAEAHCWWAAFRTALPPDSVASRSARAYTTLGLARARWASRADTACAEAGPTPLAGPERGGVLYAARVVAYRRGDTTFYRPFVGVRPPQAEIAAGDSSRVSGQRIAFCGAIGGTAQAGGTAPRDPERDDSLPVWRRRPWHVQGAPGVVTRRDGRF